uniref:Uncharacterized protein n=1 Tax=Compsopogon caeruleus TaxID=31354 RepID=A0A7S1XAX4_9RHOD|mmetsp:Transcript_10994/g.21928  ORF Transcript_10994/g.21928 Transcript_10994/m.21928 type:complete len:153 (+) Transcript_10994:105-563(+)
MSEGEGTPSSSDMWTADDENNLSALLERRYRLRPKERDKPIGFYAKNGMRMDWVLINNFRKSGGKEVGRRQIFRRRNTLKQALGDVSLPQGLGPLLTKQEIEQLVKYHSSQSSTTTFAGSPPPSSSHSSDGEETEEKTRSSVRFLLNQDVDQ